MHISHIKIENYRAHSKTEIPLPQLGCFIGENNAGKSTVLHAIRFVLEEKKLSTDDFRNPELPVTVTLQFEGICAEDLKRVSPAHRERVTEMVRSESLTIVRTQENGGKPESKFLKPSPRNTDWSSETLEAAIKSKRGATLRQAAVDLIPGLDAYLDESPTQQDVKNSWGKFVEQLPADETIYAPAVFPTGIAQGVRPLLPSVIYIEAVKDASIEAKSTGTSAFSKLLDLLFEEVSSQFEDINEKFKDVHEKLSRVFDEDGNESDRRLDAVKQIESTIEGFVQASFPGVSLTMNIPSPTLTMLLSGAELRVHDGHDGDIASKGDGLKRTVLFALLRAYASIRSSGLNEDSRGTAPKPSYVLLFEEPELYLHPKAQRQLMAALGSFSNEHQVLVTTHSPGFFRPDTKGFTRLQKTADGVSARSVDLTLGPRDAYQLVQHENNEAAFFAKQVVLVEGDSDTFTYPHLAKLLNPAWDAIDHNIMFVKIEGKGNIARYRKFFTIFEIPIHVITDLDALARGFNQLTNTPHIKDAHSKMMDSIRKQVPKPNNPNSEKVRDICGKRKPRELWHDAQNHLASFRSDPTIEIAESLEETLAELFKAGDGDATMELLADQQPSSIASMRNEVISELANEKVYVLQRGDLEDYCGTHVGKDKVATAIEFCAKTTSVEHLKTIHGDDSESVIEELRSIFTRIFDNPVLHPGVEAVIPS